MNDNKSIDEEVNRIIESVQIIDAAILKAWNERYGNKCIPSGHFEQGFLAGCKYAKDYIANGKR